MDLKTVPIWRWAFLAFVVVPVAAWALVKPVRVLAPQLVGMTCQTKTICVESPDQAESAISLYDEAVTFVSVKVKPLQASPRVVFCSSDACAQSFGLGERSAVTVGVFGAIIGPRAWKSYYLRHEMIHVVQGERLGVFSLLFKPSWLVEGMAYDLSADPRETLAEPFQTDRAMFRKWFASIDRARFWELAREI